MAILYFLILLGVLIFVHELGHFLWAKLFHVKVIRFSLGFGPKVIGFRRGETEYQISAIPIGGYVKMLGEATDEEEPKPEDAGRAFSDKPVWQRSLILVGGPVMNLLLPILIYFIVLLGQDTVDPASVGTVLAGMPAAKGGLQPGDTIVAVDGEETPAFEDVVRVVGASPEEPLRFRIRRGEREFDTEITPMRTVRSLPFLGPIDEVGRIGILPSYRTAVVGPPEGSGAAGKLQAFDEIVAVNGTRVRRLVDLERLHLPDGRAAVGLLRGRPIRTGLGEFWVAGADRVDLAGPPGASFVEAFGVTASELVVSAVRPGSPASEAGLTVGDRLLRRGDAALLTWHDLQFDPGGDGTGPQVFTVLRGAEEVEVSVTLRMEKFTDPLGQEHEIPFFGATGYLRSVFDDPIENPNRLSRAFFGAFRQTWEVIRLTGYGIAAIFQGRVPAKTIGGPLLIYDVAAQSGEAGAVPFLWAMALISINLGLLNLLPIPVLDGGHLVFFAIEAVRRKPLSRRTREIAQTVGLVLILALLAFAFWNDAVRWWSSSGCG